MLFRSVELSLNSMSRIFPARLEALGLALEFVAQALRSFGLPDDEARRAELAVEELFTNTCTHGVGASRAAGAREELTVRINVIATEGGVEIAYVDDAPAFDPLARAGGPAEEPRQEPGGLGGRIILGMARTARYERDGRLNRTCLRFGRA